MKFWGYLGNYTILFLLLGNWISPEVWARGLSSYREFMNAVQPEFSCAELRVLSLVDRTSLGAFSEIAKGRHPSHTKEQEFPGTVSYRSDSDLYEYTGSNTLEGKYNFLVSYFAQNPFDLPEYKKHARDSAEILRNIDFEKLTQKLDDLLGPVDQPKVHFYSPPKAPSTHFLMDSNKVTYLTAIQHNFFRGYGMEYLEEAKLEDQEFEPRIRATYSRSHAETLLEQRKRYLNAHFMTVNEVDCEVPRQHFIRYKTGRRLEDLEAKSKRTRIENAELRFLKEYDALEDRVEDLREERLSEGREYSSSEWAEIVHFKKLAREARSFYEPSCRPIDFAKTYHFHLAFVPQQLVVTSDDIDSLEETDSCQDVALLNGLGIYSKFPFDAKKTEAVPYYSENGRGGGHLVMPDGERAYNWHHDELTLGGVRSATDKFYHRATGLEFVTGEVAQGQESFLASTFRVGPHDLTILAAHFESHADPKYRRYQMKRLTAYANQKKTAMLLGADLNTNSFDASEGSPLRVSRTWFTRGFSISPNLGRDTNFLESFHNYLGGIVDSIPLVNSLGGILSSQEAVSVRRDPTLSFSGERGLFETAFEHGFGDFGHQANLDTILPILPTLPLLRKIPFLPLLQDVPGPVRLFARFDRTLEYLNERTNSGFVPTYDVRIPILAPLMNVKLDWFLQRNGEDSVIFGYHPRVLREFTNHFAQPEHINWVGDRISDHYPIALDFVLIPNKTP